MDGLWKICVCFLSSCLFYLQLFSLCVWDSVIRYSLTNTNVDIRRDRLSFAGCTLQAIRCTILSSRQIKLPLYNGNPRPITSASTVSHVGHAISYSPSKKPKNAVSATVNITYVWISPAHEWGIPLKQEHHSKQNPLHFQNPETPSPALCCCSRLVLYTCFLNLHILICGFIATTARGEINFSARARHKDVWGNEVTFHSFLTSALDIGERSV